MSRRSLVAVTAALLLANSATIFAQTTPADRPGGARGFNSYQGRPSTDFGAPIPVSPNSYTWRDYDKQHLDWCKRRVLAPFREAAKGQAWEAEATKFMEEAVAAWSVSSKIEKAHPDLAARGRKLLKGGCNDPLLRYFTVWLESVPSDEESPSGWDDCEKALRQLEKETRYPRAITRLVGITLLNAWAGSPRNSSKAEKSSDLDSKIVTWTREAIEEGSYDGTDDQFFVRHTLAPRWRRHLSRASDALAELYTTSTKLPAWAKHTLLGYIEVRRAWKDRGGGWAYTVTEKGWAGFGEHLKKAHAELAQGWQLRPDRPEAASEMIAVVMGGCVGPGDSLRLWFDRAVKAQFDYTVAYDELSWALQPRWGGSHEAMLAFGRACAATKRYDTRVPDYFFNVINGITLDFEDKRAVYRLPHIANELMALEQALLGAPERKDEMPERFSSLAFHAWLCGRYDEAAKALNQLRGELAPSVSRELSRFDMTKSTLMAEVAIHTNKAKADFEQARQSTLARDFTAAIKHYQAALQKVGDDALARRQLQIEMSTVMGQERLSKGEWVNVSPKAGDLELGWSVIHGKWEAPAEGVLQIRGGTEHVLVLSRLPVGTNFEVRADFEIHSPDDKGQVLGVALGYSSLQKKPWVMCMVRKLRSDTDAMVLRQYYVVGNPKIPTTFEKSNHLHIQCWNNRITHYFNGKLLFRDFESKEGAVQAPDARFGFGAHGLYARNTTRISNIEVRLLKEPPKPPDSN